MDIPLFARAREYGDRTAIIATEGIFTYRYLLHASSQVATYIVDGTEDLQQQRVAFITPPGFQYVATQWGVWRGGGIAVPLCVSHPLQELEYVISDSGVFANGYGRCLSSRSSRIPRTWKNSNG